MYLRCQGEKYNWFAVSMSENQYSNKEANQLIMIRIRITKHIGIDNNITYTFQIAVNCFRRPGLEIKILMVHHLNLWLVMSLLVIPRGLLSSPNKVSQSHCVVSWNPKKPGI